MIVEYQKIINLLEDTTNQPSKFRTRYLVEINDESKGRYDNIRFKTTTIKSSLCGYSDACILVKGTIAISNMTAAQAIVNNTYKKVILKNCASLNDCITESNNTQVDDATRIDGVMTTFNLIEYSDAYSKISENFMAILQR